MRSLLTQPLLPSAGHTLVTHLVANLHAAVKNQQEWRDALEKAPEQRDAHRPCKCHARRELHQ